MSLKQCHVGGNNVVISHRSPQNRGSVSNWRRIAFWILLDKEISEQKNVLGELLHVVLRDVLIFVLWEWPKVTRQNCSTKDVIAVVYSFFTKYRSNYCHNFPCAACLKMHFVVDTKLTGSLLQKAVTLPLEVWSSCPLHRPVQRPPRSQKAISVSVKVVSRKRRLR